MELFLGSFLNFMRTLYDFYSVSALNDAVRGIFLSLSVQINFPYLKATFFLFYLKLVFLTTVRKKVTAVNNCQDCHGHTDL